MSTFHGLEMAKQALFTQQSALYTTGHNIANANTEGYTRQRVNFETTTPFPSVGRNRPQMPGQMGTGVEAGSVQRIRNQFLDTQFRGENSLSGYWSTRAEAFSRMEGLLNEPSETGLNASMDQFWQSLNGLASNPDNSGARSVVVQRGQALAETYHYLSNSLDTIRGDLKQQLDSSVDSANSILRQIDDINTEVRKLETNGFVTNDLYDRRDVLIDELSNMMEISVQYDESSASAKDIAQGLATIKVGDIILVNGAEGGHSTVSINNGEANYDAVEKLFVTNADSEAAVIGMPPAKVGSIAALIEAYGYMDGTEVKGDFSDVIATLDDMAYQFATAFNEVHKSGFGLDGNTNRNFFGNLTSSENAAKLIQVDESIMENPSLVAASSDGISGDGGNASDLADVFYDDLDFSNGEKTSIKDFYESVIGNLGVNASEANRMADNTAILLTQVQNQRLSISSVSLDEEMSNLVKFQHAYNAAARSLTAYDELIDRVINNMGLVGR
ncbi:flagellar hook-associated protein FlgK [Oceanobacillus zhaokaii]|uniref:Flagellar hook-associated protein 1 n=1 Tax=Oceanobacillus zhaokaii TaxID=2052660 RepID=A0A345PJ39_9BACI|nr:flagellar hook-associated protein FlgK [Oceanobacillus zhaokaii]AXI10019.1 flagellar hook-associated protein FlgK [Oceanobacillus zhaokaii]